MVDNELIVGKPRLGWLIDGNPETPEAAVMLQDTGSVIELRIPLQGVFGEEGPYGRWWSSCTMYADDPERTKYSYTPPRVMLFYDDRGAVALVGCRAGGAHRSLGDGYGIIVANYAVLWPALNKVSFWGCVVGWFWGYRYRMCVWLLM